MSRLLRLDVLHIYFCCGLTTGEILVFLRLRHLFLKQMWPSLHVELKNANNLREYIWFKSKAITTQTSLVKFRIYSQENKLCSRVTRLFEVNILPKSLAVFWASLQGSPLVTSPKYLSSLGGLHSNTCLLSAKVKDDQPSISNSVTTCSGRILVSRNGFFLLWNNQVQVNAKNMPTQKNILSTSVSFSTIQINLYGVLSFSFWGSYSCTVSWCWYHGVQLINQRSTIKLNI